MPITATALTIASLLLALPVIPGAASLGLGASPLAAQGNDRPQIMSLDFEGNDAFSDEQLSGAIITRETHCASVFFQPFCWAGADFALEERFLNRTTLREDHARVQLYYWQRGYRDAQVDTTITPAEDEGVDILFQVQEGPAHRITSLEFSGLPDASGAAVSDDLPVALDDPLDLTMLDAARDTITRRLRNSGYAHADVLRNLFIPAGTRDAEVEFNIYAGPLSSFGPIEIGGNEEVAEQVIRRMLPFEEGARYGRELVLEGQRNLYGLEVFRYASITEDLDSEPDSIIPLAVQVDEGDTRRVRAGGGWSTEECFNTEARWTSRNFFGGARQMVVRGRVSNLLISPFQETLCAGAGTGEYGELDWLLSADFNQPVIFSPRNSFAASVYAERQSLRNVFVREALGLNLGLTRNIGRSASLTPYYRPQVARLDAAEVFFCTSYLVCDPTDIDLLQAANTLSPLGISFAQDRTNRVLDPSSGYVALLEMETAQSWTASDFTYNRAVAEFSTYWEVAGGFILAGRVRGGWLDAGVFEGLAASDTGMDRTIAHPEKRFYAGGSNSVRGYPQNELGPQVVSIDVESLVLPTDSVPAVCTPMQVNDLSCDASPIEDDEFLVRPTGGTRLLEGNVELRFPLGGSALRGAAFVDFGDVWNPDASIGVDDLVFTPGIGVRYSTPIGPVRIDLAYRSIPTRNIPAVTSQLRPFDESMDGPEDRIGAGTPDEIDWVRDENLALLNPLVPIGDDDPAWWEHIQLHLSIGQAF